MSRIHRSAFTLIRTALVAAAVAIVASCGTQGGSPAEPVTSGYCTSDLSCPYGEECGSGACVAMSASLYPHIQVASSLFRDHLDQNEVVWRAAHYDLLINRVLHHADDFRAVNPNVRLFEYMYARYNNYDDFGNRVTEWAQARGLDPEDFYLHYREDTAVPTWEGVVLVEGHAPGVVPGWNPARGPMDPPASAASREESRVPGMNAGWFAGGIPWKMASINNNDYRRFLLDWATWVLDGSLDNLTLAGGPIDGIVFDNAIYYPMFGEGVLDKTDEYYGLPLNDQHPHALGFATLYPEIADGLAARYGQAADIMPNFGHILFTEHPDAAAQSVVANIPWIWGEVWLTYNVYQVPITGPDRALTYDVDYRKALLPVVKQTRGSKRRVLGARDYSNGEVGTDRGRIFTLALYYLVQNRNTYYLYQTVPDHESPAHMSQWMWNPAVEFDIGQPDQVPPGTTDFEGNYPSDEHYIFAEGPDPFDPDLTYRVLARRYTNALVLAKMMPAGSTNSVNSETTHQLDGSYAVLQADGTLGAVVTEVTIRNNQGFILIPVD